jgi:transposase
VFFPINPSHAKDDPSNAELQLELVLTHRDKLAPLIPQSPQMRALAQLVDHRRRLVNDKVRLTNRLTSTLKNYFPHVLTRFHDKDTPLFGDFLSQWPTLKAAQPTRRSTLERFFRTHHVREAEGIAQRLQAIKKATPLTMDEGVIVPHALFVQRLVTQLRVTVEAIAAFDQAIAERARSHPDFALFDTLPGAGSVFAPRLLVAFGEQRARFTSADAV